MLDVHCRRLVLLEELFQLVLPPARRIQSKEQRLMPGSAHGQPQQLSLGLGCTRALLAALNFRQCAGGTVRSNLWSVLMIKA